MAELLVFTRDVVGIDIYHTAKLPKRGYVITVQDDGWNWGKIELADAMFRVLKFPGQPITNFTQFLSWETPTQPLIVPSDITNTLQMRGNKFNIDDPTLPLDVQAVIADDTRKQPTASMSLTATAISSLTVSMTAIQDPAVIGPSPTVI